MNNNAGLWIDHRKAVIVVLSGKLEETTLIESSVEKQPRRASDPSEGSFKAHEAPADDSRDRGFSGHLAPYYDRVIAHLKDAGSILIFGPGEAKGELKKRFELHKADARPIVVECADKMTGPQIVAQVRGHFQKQGD